MADEQIDWPNIEWELQDIVLADMYDVTRERVRQKREDLGIPDPDDKFRRRVSARTRIKDVDTTNMTLTACAKIGKVKKQHMRNILIDLEKDWKHEDGRTKGKWPWDRVTLDQMKTWPDSRIAAKMTKLSKSGDTCSDEVVALYRHRKGIKKKTRTVAKV